MKQDSLHRKLQRINDLPSLPSMVFEAVHLLDHPDITIERFISSIQLDQAIVSKILRLVNSSFYGFQGLIAANDQAIRLPRRCHGNKPESFHIPAAAYHRKHFGKSAGVKPVKNPYGFGDFF